MSILSGSVIVPVEAIGGLSASAGGELATYALPVAAPGSDDVTNGRALSSTLFTAGADNKSILMALNSVAGTAGGNLTILAGDGLGGGGTVAIGGSVTLSASVDNSSIEISSDALQVKEGGITNAMLAGSIANAKLSNSSVTVTAGDALTGGGAVALGGTATLNVAVDGSSIEVSSDALQVKEGGITNAMLAGSIANAKLTNSSVTVSAGSGLSGGGAIALGGSATVTLDVTNANTWEGIQKFDAPLQLKDQTDGTYFKVDVDNGFLRVYA